MKKESKEIEMQTYSMSYAYPVNYPTALPYNWDGDSHLTINPSFYASEEEPIPDLSDQFFWDEEKEEGEKEEDLYDDELSPMHCSEPQRTESVASAGSLSTEAPSSVNSKTGSLDQQLDFILDSVKKQKKGSPKKPKSEKKKMTRRRKTSSQLELLQNEVGEGEVLDKAKMRLLAEKTGLKVGQVYKWYWDLRRKQSTLPNASQC